MKPFLCLATTALTAALLTGLCRADGERPARPQFKGVELYSWKDKGGGWTFVLLDGTNRLKTEEEVKSAKTRLKGVRALKKALARLAVGEQVSWTHLIPGFEYPPRRVREEVAKAAKDAKVDLRIPRQVK